MTVKERGHAAVYSRGDAFYVTAEDRTADGFFNIGSVSSVEANEGDSALGAAIVAALDESRDDVPTPDRDPPVSDPLLKVSGTKTWRTFAMQAELVRVRREGTLIRLERWRHMARGSDAFEMDRERTPRSMNTPDPVDLGEAVRQSLA